MLDSVGAGCYNGNMINELVDALETLNVNVRRVGDTLFVGQWGIHCTLSGNVQARNLYDSAERFGLGTVQSPVEALVANIVALP